MTYRMSSAPRILRRARPDNIALVPGNLPPMKGAWREVANRLPRRGVLIVLPEGNALQKETLLKLAKVFAADGHQVSVMNQKELRHRAGWSKPSFQLALESALTLDSRPVLEYDSSLPNGKGVDGWYRFSNHGDEGGHLAINGQQLSRSRQRAGRACPDGCGWPDILKTRAHASPRLKAAMTRLGVSIDRAIE